MRAWRAHAHGEPTDVLHLDDTEPPTPAPGEVAIDVRAAGLNFADLLLCRGTYQERPPLPFTPGLELSGVVRAVAADVESVRVGDRVAALPALPHGALAEVAVARAADCLPLPTDVDDRNAAAMIITYQTGWFGLKHRAGLRPGETLVVHAGASGVGSAAIQLGVALGARVIATAGGAEKVQRCRELGAHDAIDYREVDLVDALRSITKGRGAEVIYDPVGGDVFDASRRCLAFEGRLVVVGFASGRVPESPMNHALVKNYTIIGLNWGAYRTHDPTLVRRAHDELIAMLRSGAIAPLVMTVRPLADAPAALELLRDRGAVGKVLIEP